MRALRIPRTIALLISGAIVVAATAVSVAVTSAERDGSCNLHFGSVLSTPVAGGSFGLYVPLGLKAYSKVPLLVSLHGAGSSGPVQSRIARWTKFSDRQTVLGKPFIAIFPDSSTTDLSWSWGGESVPDSQLVFNAMQSIIDSSHCIDSHHIYVDGWSAGGFMAQRVACADGDPAIDEHGLHIAGISAYASGDPSAGANAPCQPRRRVPILLTQGTRDKVVNPQRVGFAGFSAWADRYGCSTPTEPYTMAQQLVGCRGGTKVAWLPIPAFEHTTWSCKADLLWHNQVIWDFLTHGTVPTDATCPGKHQA